jgi:phosphoglycolate phosphatase
MIRGLVFDKDGTLFDFKTTWNAWSAGLIRRFANGDPEREAALADATHFDMARQSFLPSSPIIAGTNREAAEIFASVVSEHSVEELEHILMNATFDAPQAEVVPLSEYFSDLRARGFKAGVVTNDTEAGAMAHLQRAHATKHLDFIAGFDSGYGAKPDPDPLLAFATHVGLSPSQVAMVGDSTHDLVSAKRAGMYRIGVLTGMADYDDLAPYADVVLPHIGHIVAHLQNIQNN